MTIKMYRTRSFNVEIKEIEIERRTDKSVWLNDAYGLSRFCRHSGNDNYWDTWDDAQKYLFEKWKRKIESLEWQIERAKDTLSDVKRMKK